MNAVGNVRCSVVIVGEHDLTRQTARAMIERIDPVVRAHASAIWWRWKPRWKNHTVQPAIRANELAGARQINREKRLPKIRGHGIIRSCLCPSHGLRIVKSLSRHIVGLRVARMAA